MICEISQYNMHVDKAVAQVHSTREVCQLLKCSFYLLHVLGVLLDNTIAVRKWSGFLQQLTTDFKGR